ncbi:MAG: potassium channel protein [Desulfobacteraceae bacterium]|nr:potassium channel protein [Desulfobacteraceae bacterium]
MLYFIKQLVKPVLKRKGFSLILAYMLLLALSSFSITLVEPKESALTHLGQALWWSIVTSTTVGYGDIYPASPLGKAIAVCLPMFMGIGLGAAFITHVASSIIERRDKKMHGEETYHNKNHIVLVGATDETQYLMEQILEDENWSNREIVLAANIKRHPLPENPDIFFIKGRPDTKETLEKANISQAANVIIHTGNDEENLFALVNTLKLKNEACNVTVHCHSSSSLDTFSSVPGNFEIIMQMTAEVMVQAMQDKVHIPLQVLLQNNDDQEIYYIVLPELAHDLTWWELHDYLKNKYDYLSFAIKFTDDSILVNPSQATPVKKGCGIWLIAEQRPVDILWPA